LTSSRPQLENPTSTPLEIPIGKNFETLTSQGILINGIFVVLWYKHRIIVDKKNFQTKWHETTINGKW